MKKWKYISAMVIVVCVLIPMILIVIVSTFERNNYKIVRMHEVQSKSFGAPGLITRGDVDEKITLEGIATSLTIEEIPIGDTYENKVTLYKDIEAEVFKGEVIGNINGNDIVSSFNGKIIDVVLSEKGYIKILNFDELVFETKVPTSFDYKNLKDEETNKTLELISLSNEVSNNERTAVFKLSKNNYLFGEQLEFHLLSGKKETGVLLAPKSCVYMRGDDSNNYVRQVDGNENFMDEIEVKTGISDNQKIVIIGDIKEGAFCDGGYKQYIEMDETPYESSNQD